MGADARIYLRAYSSYPPAKLDLTRVAFFSQMYKVNTTAPRVLARIARMPNVVVLDMTQEAMQLSLLEPALVAAVMLSCGSNID